MNALIDFFAKQIILITLECNNGKCFDALQKLILFYKKYNLLIVLPANSTIQSSIIPKKDNKKGQ